MNNNRNIPVFYQIMKTVIDFIAANRFRVAVVLVLVLLTGCSSLQRTESSHPASLADSEEYYWSRAVFRFEWPAEVQPDFSYHLMVADQALSQIIADCKKQLVLWRFHRRAARDKGGHAFSFLYYTDAEGASDIRQRVESQPLLQLLQQHGVIKKITFTRGQPPGSEDIAATSDKNWPPQIQTSWPWFIQGVSQSWLDLVRLQRETSELAVIDHVNPDIDRLLADYRQINQQLAEQWGRFGRHAYLHHLNAAFGYMPVYIHESQSWQRF